MAHGQLPPSGPEGPGAGGPLARSPAEPPPPPLRCALGRPVAACGPASASPSLAPRRGRRGFPRGMGARRVTCRCCSWKCCPPSLALDFLTSGSPRLGCTSSESRGHRGGEQGPHQGAGRRGARWGPGQARRGSRPGAAGRLPLVVQLVEVVEAAGVHEAVESPEPRPPARGLARKHLWVTASAKPRGRRVARRKDQLGGTWSAGRRSDWDPCFRAPWATPGRRLRYPGQPGQTASGRSFFWRSLHTPRKAPCNGLRTDKPARRLHTSHRRLLQRYCGPHPCVGGSPGLAQGPALTRTRATVPSPGQTLSPGRPSQPTRFPRPLKGLANAGRLGLRETKYAHRRTDASEGRSLQQPSTACNPGSHSYATSTCLG